jgi:putative SOS response-associated peptidase YedK
MCYRVATDEKEKVEKQFNRKVEQIDLFNQYHHVSGFSKPHLPTITGEHEMIQMLQWKSRDEFNTLNAKSETLHDKYFKKFVNRRCLILVKGFFEHRDHNKKKYPYFIRAKGTGSFAIGGIYSDQNTLSIITTEANELMAMIHNTKLRMPLIIPEERYSTWLQADLNKAEIENLMIPFPAEEMEAYTISTMITNTKINTNVEDVLKPVQYAELNPPPTLF